MNVTTKIIKMMMLMTIIIQSPISGKFSDKKYIIEEKCFYGDEVV